MDIGDVEYQVAILVRRAVLASRRKGSLDRSAYLLLRALRDHGPLGVRELSQHFHLDASTVSRQTAVLQRRGDVERLPNPDDRRASHFRPTEQGLAKLRAEQQARQQLYDRLLLGWSAKDRADLARLLARLNHTFVD